MGSSSEAVVIDASVEPAIYARLAAERGWTIRHVVDTHLHADHLSRSKALARASSANLLLPSQDRVAFAFTPLQNGQAIEFGRSRITVISAPGHTMESACYYLDGQALFTGDTLFVSGVGRPDLHATPNETRERARVLYRSLRRVLELPADTLVFPGHASEPPAFDGKPIAERLGQISTRIAGWLS
jgi:glyoxylase-like metal-dependent hydrolase (beta-lactamase superfamily II)